uniref:Uncharacterized protein n=1 Tax=Caenorhabditis japonica TaxID=281687 RepID=A0A8R1IC48_CAEJA
MEADPLEPSTPPHLRRAVDPQNPQRRGTTTTFKATPRSRSKPKQTRQRELNPSHPSQASKQHLNRVNPSNDTSIRSLHEWPRETHQKPSDQHQSRNIIIINDHARSGENGGGVMSGLAQAYILPGTHVTSPPCLS